MPAGDPLRARRRVAFARPDRGRRLRKKAKGDDLDANDDGTLELPSDAKVLDSVGWLDDGSGKLYAQVKLTQSASNPDAATRFADNVKANDASAWCNGDIHEDDSSTPGRHALRRQRGQRLPAAQRQADPRRREHRPGPLRAPQRDRGRAAQRQRQPGVRGADGQLHPVPGGRLLRGPGQGGQGQGRLRQVLPGPVRRRLRPARPVQRRQLHDRQDRHGRVRDRLRAGSASCPTPARSCSSTAPSPRSPRGRTWTRTTTASSTCSPGPSCWTAWAWATRPTKAKSPP